MFTTWRPPLAGTTAPAAGGIWGLDAAIDKHLTWGGARLALTDPNHEDPARRVECLPHEPVVAAAHICRPVSVALAPSDVKKGFGRRCRCPVTITVRLSQDVEARPTRRLPSPRTSSPMSCGA